MLLNKNVKTSSNFFKTAHLDLSGSFFVISMNKEKPVSSDSGIKYMTPYNRSWPELLMSTESPNKSQCTVNSRSLFCHEMISRVTVLDFTIFPCNKMLVNKIWNLNKYSSITHIWRWPVSSVSYPAQWTSPSGHQ